MWLIAQMVIFGFRLPVATTHPAAFPSLRQVLRAHPEIFVRVLKPLNPKP